MPLFFLIKKLSYPPIVKYIFLTRNENPLPKSEQIFSCFYSEWPCWISPSASVQAASLQSWPDLSVISSSVPAGHRPVQSGFEAADRHSPSNTHLVSVRPRFHRKENSFPARLLCVSCAASQRNHIFSMTCAPRTPSNLSTKLVTNSQLSIQAWLGAAVQTSAVIFFESNCRCHNNPHQQEDFYEITLGLTPATRHFWHRGSARVSDEALVCCFRYEARAHIHTHRC